MQDSLFVDETFDINLTQSYNLSIQSNLNGLSFSILDPVRNKFIALVHNNFSKDLIFNDLLNTIEVYIKKNELLNCSYKNVKIIWLSNKNTLIPADYFNKEDLRKHFEFNQKLDDLDEIHYKQIKIIDSYSIYTVPNQIANIFNRQFPGINFYNQQIPFIIYSLYKYHSGSKKIFINLSEEFIDISITQTGELLFYNNFIYKTESDIMYFIMYVLEQFKSSDENIEIILSGNITKKSGLFLMLKEHYDHIKFLKSPEDYSYSYTFSTIPLHSFSNLFNLNFCE